MADEIIDRLRQKYKERAEPERDLVDNRKAVAHVKAEKQMKGRPPTEDDYQTRKTAVRSRISVQRADDVRQKA